MRMQRRKRESNYQKKMDDPMRERGLADRCADLGGLALGQ
jgi:hypothetical protein